MKVIDEFLNGVQLLEVARFEDQRGHFTVLHQDETAAAAALPAVFVQDNLSVSTSAGTVRGLHLQLDPWAQGKLVEVIAGSIFDVVVDLRSDSPTRGQHRATEIGAKMSAALWVPRGFAHGFCTLEPETVVFYKVDTAYRPDHERSLAWDDAALNIDWPVASDEALLSPKDEAGLDLVTILAEIDHDGTATR